MILHVLILIHEYATAVPMLSDFLVLKSNCLTSDQRGLQVVLGQLSSWLVILTPLNYRVGSGFAILSDNRINRIHLTIL